MTLRLLALLCCSALTLNALAQEKFPNRPIEFSVPLTPGATVDIVARLYGDRLSQRVGQPVTVVNRPGAGGVLATVPVVKAKPDGHTLLFGNSQHSINAGLLPDLPYDTVRDFSGVTLVAEAPSLIIVSTGLGVKTLRDFIALAKKKPGSINYGGGTPGSATHMAGADFAAAAGVQLTYIAYKGGSIIPDLIENRIQAMFVAVPFLLSQIKDGKLLALAVTSPEPLKVPLSVPAAQESGMPGYSYSTWYGLIAAAKTPPAILARLNTEMNGISEEAAVKDKLVDLGMLPRRIALRDFDTFIRSDVERVTALIRANNIKPE
jgi:tripartite-type tricarboxylate transporter receptor subunit TctC